VLAPRGYPWQQRICPNFTVRSVGGVLTERPAAA
jgi:hypothetical protein